MKNEIRYYRCRQIANGNGRGESDRNNATKQNNGNHRFTIRFDTDCWENDRANRKFAAFDHGVLEIAEKR